MSLVRIVSCPGDGLALLTVRYFGELYVERMWARVKSRKGGTCAASGVDYQSGATAYRPALGNPSNRSQRMLATVIDR